MSGIEISYHGSATGTLHDATLTIEPGLIRCRDGIYFNTSGRDSGWLDAQAARDLGEWLAQRYGIKGWAPNVGDTVRILPGHYISDEGATCGTVTRGLDSDGEYRVKLGDGDEVGEAYYIAAEFLAHPDAVIPEPTTPPAPAAPTFTPERGDVVKLTDPGEATRGVITLPKDSDGEYRVLFLDGPGKGEYGYVAAKFVAPLDEAAPVMKVGDIVELKPDAKTADGSRTYFHDVTRVKILRALDDDGDYRVERVNGSGTSTQYVGAAYLAPLPADGAWVAGDYAVMAEAYGASFREGDRVQLTRVFTNDRGTFAAFRRTSDGETGTCYTSRLRRP